MDLIDAIARHVGFEYVFVPVADQQYGKLDKETKQWNGIIGEIINNVSGKDECSGCNINCFLRMHTWESAT